MDWTQTKWNGTGQWAQRKSVSCSFSVSKISLGLSSNQQFSFFNVVAVRADLPHTEVLVGWPRNSCRLFGRSRCGWTPSRADRQRTCLSIDYRMMQDAISQFIAYLPSCLMQCNYNSAHGLVPPHANNVSNFKHSPQDPRVLKVGQREPQVILAIPNQPGSKSPITVNQHRKLCDSVRKELTLSRGGPSTPCVSIAKDGRDLIVF